MSNSTGSKSDTSLTEGIYTSRNCLNSVLVSVFFTIAAYNVVELLILCFTRFKWRDCYFWTLLVASVGIIPYILGLVLKLFNIVSNNYVGLSISTIGWYCMVTGQSMVLWSRLHLLIQSRRLLRGILYIIVIDAFLFHVPATVFAFGANEPSPPPAMVNGYIIVEKIQLIGFLTQEAILSGLYIYKTVEFLQTHVRNRYWGILHQLLVINALIILMDVAFVTVEYLGFFAIQVSLKALVYSVELKMEYAILGKLVKVVNAQLKDTGWYNDTNGTRRSSVT